MIRLESVAKAFGEKKVIRKLSLHVKENEVLALLGSNGCGKSTTLNMIAGLLPPDDGEIFIDGRLVSGTRGKKTINAPPSSRKLGYIFQSLSLFPHMNVRYNIEYGLRSCHLSEQKIDIQTKKLLEFVGMAEYGNYFPHQLSGGQKQRISIARSIATNPKILLMDEPFSTVDARSRESLLLAFKSMIRNLKTTTIYVTHNLSEAFMMADRIAILENGCIEQIGKPDEILSRPRSRFIAEFLGTNIYDEEVVVPASKPGQIEIAGIPVNVPATNFDPRQEILVTIQSEDVSLLLEPHTSNLHAPDQTCNVLVGEIVDVLQMKSKVQLIIDVGFRIKSEISLRSFVDLNLMEGKKVYVQFKVNVSLKNAEAYGEV